MDIYCIIIIILLSPGMATDRAAEAGRQAHILADTICIK